MMVERVEVRRLVLSLDDQKMEAFAVLTEPAAPLAGMTIHIEAHFQASAGKPPPELSDEQILELLRRALG
jgi:hypothetical protein